MKAGWTYPWMLMPGEAESFSEYIDFNIKDETKDNFEIIWFKLLDSGDNKLAEGELWVYHKGCKDKHYYFTLKWDGTNLTKVVSCFP
jgi:hypothetical protein